MEKINIQTLKGNLDLVSVVESHGVRLERQGKEYAGLCPFHDDRHPSFRVNPELQLWNCFPCGIGGDVISFVQRIEEVDFEEATQILASQSSVRGHFSLKRLKKRLQHLAHMTSDTKAVVDCLNSFITESMKNLYKGVEWQLMRDDFYWLGICEKKGWVNRYYSLIDERGYHQFLLFKQLWDGLFGWVDTELLRLRYLSEPLQELGESHKSFIKKYSTLRKRFLPGGRNERLAQFRGEGRRLSSRVSV